MDSTRQHHINNGERALQNNSTATHHRPAHLCSCGICPRGSQRTVVLRPRDGLAVAQQGTSEQVAQRAAMAAMTHLMSGPQEANTITPRIRTMAASPQVFSVNQSQAHLQMNHGVSANRDTLVAQATGNRFGSSQSLLGAEDRPHRALMTTSISMRLNHVSVSAPANQPSTANTQMLLRTQTQVYQQVNHGLHAHRNVVGVDRSGATAPRSSTSFRHQRQRQTRSTRRARQWAASRAATSQASTSANGQLNQDAVTNHQAVFIYVAQWQA